MPHLSIHLIPSQDELTEIATALQTPLGNASKHAILKLSEALFLAFDTDENLLVDALEVLVTLCLLSGMEPQAKQVRRRSRAARPPSPLPRCCGF